MSALAQKVDKETAKRTAEHNRRVAALESGMDSLKLQLDEARQRESRLNADFKAATVELKAAKGTIETMRQTVEQYDALMEAYTKLKVMVSVMAAVVDEHQ
jgi:chromosome segregation ATPase